MGPRCDSGAVFDRFLAPQGALGISKITQIHRTVNKNQGFVICSLSRLLTPIWERLGPLLGGFLAPKIAQTCSWSPPGPIQNYVNRLLAAPRALSRQVLALENLGGRAPGADQAVLRSPRGLQEPPGPLQERSGTRFPASGTLRKTSKTTKNPGHTSGRPLARALDPRSQARRNARSD